ncbi:nuclear transport factor 2 family protein [Actinomadura sp. ATCC 31491]|uniref:Nuclear transport factor 2 family protein n=1 Tax=Actinomadura luzonensis TaxID=2805427 RepID=A0ABT0FYK0_9ACTN|nr:nuclear transport factor 2 family protein [Actinomadura luzonensis]MCK2217020.1 nuclear transport factor 2 family protein [Actinomadura luzonensis]
MGAVPSKQVIMDAWRVFATRDPGRVGALFTPDAEWLAPPGNATALALDGTHHLIGRDRIVRFLTEEFPAVFVDDVSVTFTGVHADGDTVVAEARLRATLAHGGHYDNEYCFVFELESGLVRRVREYMDTQRGAAWFRAPATAEPAGG